MDMRGLAKRVLEGQMLTLTQCLLCSMEWRIEIEPCRSSMSARHGRSMSHSDLHLIARAIVVHDVRIGVGYFEYDLYGGVTGAAGHGRTASYDKVSVRGILSALGGRSGTTDHCRTLTCTSSLTRPMCVMLGLESGISSMISTMVSLVRTPHQPPPLRSRERPRVR